MPSSFTAARAMAAARSIGGFSTLRSTARGVFHSLREAYRIVSFDQRGAGQSKSLRGDWRDTNTTEKLVEEGLSFRFHFSLYSNT